MYFKKILIAPQVYELLLTVLAVKRLCKYSLTSLTEACFAQDNIERRSIQLVNRCYMCLQNSKSIGHLFLHCTIVADLWNMFYYIFGLNWSRHTQLKMHMRDGAYGFFFYGISTPNHSLKARCLLNLSS